MPRCQFTTKYWDYQTRKMEDFNCDEELASGFCIFHDKDYLQDKANYEEHKRKVLDTLTHKVNNTISNNKPERLFCIGFRLPEFSLSDLSIISKEFTKPVYFSGSHFFGKADFYGAKFKTEVHFDGAKFQGEASFYFANFQEEADFDYSEFYGMTHFSGHFNDKTTFNYVLFEGKEKVIFDIENLSNVSFMNTDLTGVRFSAKARWGEKKAKEDRFKIIEERLLDEKIKEKEEIQEEHKPSIENEPIGESNTELVLEKMKRKDT